jgi:hypothetical protein
VASVASPSTGSSSDGIAAKSTSPAIAIAAIVLAVLFQIELVFGKSINWDEFFHYSQIHQHAHGLEVQWLQTPHVWLFGWVPGLPGDVIGHIRLIRLLIIPFELLTVLAIFDSARRLAGREAGFVCAVAYLTGGYIFLQGFALRADMIATGLLMAGLWIFLWRPLRAFELAAVALIVGLATIATIKSAFYAPAFIAVALMRRNELFAWNRATKRLAIGAALGLAAVAAAGFALGYAFDVLNLARSAAARMFSAGFFPQWIFLSAQVKFAPFLSLLLATALPVLWIERKTRPHALVLALFLVPLLSVAVYRNAFPYYFGFIFAPAMLALAPAARAFARAIGGTVLVVLMLLNATWLWHNEDRSVIERQRTVQAGIREIFPEPVRQFDDVAFVSDYPRAVRRFASGWGLEAYRRRGRLDYEQEMRREPVPLLLRQGHALEQLVPDPNDEYALLPRDTQMLADNYIQHWGWVYVPGKRIPAGSAIREIEILAPAPYTVEGAAVEIDGRRLAPGDVIALGKGMHRVAPPQAGEAVLRYGDHLPVPREPWPEGRLFTVY